jgi:uncharacterized protein DUF1707
MSVDWVEACTMEERRALRASDTDRQAAVDQLKAAHDEGRLNLHEYDDRLARAYQAVTYGDLADLFVDLPSPTFDARTAPGKAVAPSQPASVSVPRSAPVEPRGLFAGLPTTLRVLWTIWVTAVSINLVVWLLVSVSNTNLHYFWPMWVAGPPGAALLGLSIGATALRRNRHRP